VLVVLVVLIVIVLIIALITWAFYKDTKDTNLNPDEYNIMIIDHYNTDITLIVYIFICMSSIDKYQNYYY